MHMTKASVLEKFWGLGATQMWRCMNHMPGGLVLPMITSEIMK